MLKNLSLLILLVIWCCRGDAQGLNARQLTIRDGLSQNTVQAIIKDKSGFMWFGTWNGLCRFDGYRFTVYKHKQSDKSSLADNRIHHIYKDTHGSLWILLFNSQVSRYNYVTDNFTNYSLKQLPRWLQDAVSRRQNMVAMQALSATLQQVVGTYKASSTGEHIVFQDNQTGLVKLPDPNVYCAYLDNEQILWLGMASGGALAIDLGTPKFTFTPLFDQSRPSWPMAARAIIANGHGTWIGTTDMGLFLQPDLSQKTVKINGGLSNNVRSLFKDNHGNIWIGYRAGLDQYDVHTGQITHRLPVDTTKGPTYRINGMAEDPDNGAIWFGAFNRLLRYTPISKHFDEYLLPNNIQIAGITCLSFDTNGTLWIGTEYAGVIKLPRSIRSKMVPSTPYTVPGQLNLPEQRVYAVLPDRYGHVWVGTANGLCEFNKQDVLVKTFTTKDGLADQYICSVLSDRAGNIWVSHKKGISNIQTSTGTVLNYTNIENFSDKDFMESSGFSAPSGKLYFGNTGGVVSFMPEMVHAGNFLPRVHLTGLEILNNPIQVGQKVNEMVILPKSLEETHQIIISHDDRSFSLSFSALQYTDPQRNRYAYQLDGYDKDWVRTDPGSRMATYSDLPSGSYLFKVKASNSDGIWNTKPLTLRIVVLPPWWASWWAYIIYVALAMVLTYVIYRTSQARKLHARQLLVERLKAEQAKELEQHRSAFFTNVSHELRTPLTLIAGPLDELVSGEKSATQATKYYHIMQQNVRRLLGLINELLSFRKLETGHMEAHGRKENIISFMRSVIASFDYAISKKNIGFQFIPDDESLEFIFDPHILDKILCNLLANAIKFTPVGGEITISVGRSDTDPEQVIIRVCDNGAGIPSKDLEKIFEPFYQSGYTEDQQHLGTGVGLALVKELVMLHHGNISAASQPGVLTCFTVTMGILTESEQEPASPGKWKTEQEPVAKSSILADDVARPDTPIVLIAEDNTDIRQFLKGILSGDYEVIEAPNGAEAITKAVEVVPDIVISDVMMPGVDGMELCQKIKTDQRTSHIPVILLTARGSDEYQALGYESGADAYVTKPFNPELLLVRISNLLQSRKKLRTLFSAATGFDTQLVGSTIADKAFVSKLTALIEAKLGDQELSVEWLAGEIGLGRTQLYRKIRSLTDQSVHEFINTIRLKKAADLILTRQLSIAEIAYQMGYAEPASFSRSFQKQFGLSPKQYGLKKLPANG